MTVRVASGVRRRLERLAADEGRSLSQLVGRLLDQALADRRPAPARGARPLAGALHGGGVPSLRDFRETRGILSKGIDRRTRIASDAPARR